MYQSNNTQLMKKFYTLLLVATLALSFSSCNFSQAKLRTIINELNKECPIEMGVMGSMSHATYENDTVTFFYQIDGTLLNFPALKENIDEFHKNMLESYRNTDSESFLMILQTIAKSDATLKVVMSDKNSDNEIALYFDKEELSDLSRTTQHDPEENLEAIVNTCTLQGETDMGDGMTQSQVTLDGGFISYVILCDEEVYDIDLLAENEAEIYANIIDEFQQHDPVMDKMLKDLVATNRGIRYIYRGSTSGNEYTLDIEAQKIKEIYQQK